MYNNHSGRKFTGSCKEDLEGSVIIHHPNKRVMAKQYIAFEKRMITAAGNVSSAMATSMKQKKAVTIDYFFKRKICVEECIKFKKDWSRMYFRGIGQICRKTLQQMERCHNWESIEEQHDPGEFMKLLQTVCLLGSDKEYFPLRLINSLTALITLEQGDSSPAEYSEEIKLYNDVLNNVAQMDDAVDATADVATFWGSIPGLRRFVIDKFDDFKFEHKMLESQDADVRQLVQKRCQDVMLDCLMSTN